MSRFDRQFRAAAAAYDNACDCREHDAFGEDDAEGEVAAQLIAADEVTELVADVRGTLALLSWIADRGLPEYLLPQYRALERQARSLDAAVDAAMRRAA